MSEVVAEVVALDLERLRLRFASEIKAFVEGAPDLETQHLAEAKAAEFDDEELANLAEAWARARRVKAPPLQPAQGWAARARAKLRQGQAKSGLAERLEAALQQQAKPKPEEEEAKPAEKIEEPQAKAEPAVDAPLLVPLAPQGFFQSEPISPAEPEEVLCLDPAAPFDNAQKLISLRAWHRSEGIRTLEYWQRSFWEWNGTHWREADDDTVRASVWHQLNAAEKFVKGGKRARFEPKMSDVNATLDALRGAVNLRASAENAMPGWFGTGRPDGDLRELVACQNGILHIPSRKLLPHTPRYWSPNALDFAYDPAASAPRFEEFLREIWPGDVQAQQCLLEMFGLCLTDITKYQKAFMFVGPRRGGRGTIGRVLRRLIGPRNYIGTSLKAFSEQFGMENFIGKKVAVFSDARLDGMPQRNLSTITERLLLITGEDEMHINRKNTKYWEGKLATRVVIFSNELLRLPDESGALPGRFLTFRMQQSFYGREDANLTDKLLAERSGILNLALDALDRLRARGRLIQCGSGEEMSESLGELASDVSIFVEEKCVADPKQEILLQKLFVAWQAWCSSRGIRHPWGSNTFSEKLRAAVPTITKGRPRKDNPSRATMLFGIGLRPKG